jgi:hypothetical protein
VATQGYDPSLGTADKYLVAPPLDTAAYRARNPGRIDTAARAAVGYSVGGAVGGKGVLGKLGAHIAWADHADMQTAVGYLGAQRVEPPPHCKFGCGIGGTAWQPDIAHHTAYCHHAAAGAGKKQWQSGAGKADGAKIIHFHDGSLNFRQGILGKPSLADAGVVDQDIEPAVVPLYFFDCGTKFGGTGNVQR